MDHIHSIFDQLVQRGEREQFLNQRASVFWLTGLSGSGKSTIAKGVERKLFQNGYLAQVLDGDNIRSGICNNLSFSIEDRHENIRRISEIAKLYVNSGLITICSFISPTLSIRAQAREIITPDDFNEIYIDAPVHLCEERDVKGLYQKARSGLIKGFTGIDAPYEPPINPHMIVTTGSQSIDESVEQLYIYIIEKTKLV